MGINSRMLLLNGAGRVRCSTSAAPAVSVGGTPITSGGLLSLDLTAPTRYAAAIGYGSNGAIAADVGGTIARFAPGGVPLSAADRLVGDTAAAITTYVAGTPRTATGALALATPE